MYRLDTGITSPKTGLKVLFVVSILSETRPNHSDFTYVIYQENKEDRETIHSCFYVNIFSTILKSVGFEIKIHSFSIIFMI